MPECNFVPASELFEQWQEDVLSGRRPVRYQVGTGDLARFTLAPRHITMIGGAPGGGKTAFVMQTVTDALRVQSELRACIANVEMPPEVLLDRQLARFSGVELSTVIMRQFTAEERSRLNRALPFLGAVLQRMCFVSHPFELDNVAQAVNTFGAHIVVVDYIQRFRAAGDSQDRRGAIDASMSHLREFADAGKAVVVVSSVGRAKGKRGQSSYDAGALNLASFKESGELEYGCDDAYLLIENPRSSQGVILRHLKARYSEPQDIELFFDRPHQAFRTAAEQSRIACYPAGGRGTPRP